MFKLISLFSPSGLFKPIYFTDGLNIILGKYTQEGKGKDINGIGKTTIVDLIDFCLLADGPKSTFFSENYKFLKSETVVLSFVINGENYLIQRDFVNKTSALLSINESDYTEYRDTDLRLIFGRLIMRNQEYRGIYSAAWFRTIMNFFIQNDHSYLARDSRQVEKFISGGYRKSELIAFNMFLLGLNNTNIWNYDENRQELKLYQADQTRIRKQVTELTGKSFDSFKAEIEAIERKAKQLEESLRTYKFEPSYSGLEDKIEALSIEISKLNKEHVIARRKLADIKESLTIDTDIDIERIKELYDELNSQFSAFIHKELSEIIDFRTQISTNRSIFLNTREKVYSERLGELEDKINKLEDGRSELYKRLEEQNAFDAIKSAYTSLLEERSELSNRQAFVKQLDLVEEKIASKKEEVSNIAADIVRSRLEILAQIKEIKETFIEIVENSVDIDVFDVQPYFSIEPRSNISSPMQFKIDVPRSGSLGKGRFKILAYDLTLFLNACRQDRSLPRFLIHDGVFHSIAHKTRINLLNYLDEKFRTETDIQYIITLNEDEIIFPEELAESITHLNFDLEQKALIILEDRPEKMFFGKEFG